jgi:hypothetical protein
VLAAEELGAALHQVPGLGIFRHRAAA